MFSDDFRDRSRRRVLEEGTGTEEAFARCLEETRELVRCLEIRLATERKALEDGEMHLAVRNVLFKRRRREER